MRSFFCSFLYSITTWQIPNFNFYLHGIEFLNEFFSLGQYDIFAQSAIWYRSNGYYIYNIILIVSLIISRVNWNTSSHSVTSKVCYTGSIIHHDRYITQYHKNAMYKSHEKTKLPSHLITDLISYVHCFAVSFITYSSTRLYIYEVIHSWNASYFKTRHRKKKKEMKRNNFWSVTKFSQLRHQSSGNEMKFTSNFQCRFAYAKLHTETLIF